MGPSVLILVGLVIDILGAFILGVEAIGVERVRRWGESIGAYMTGKRMAWMNRFVLVSLFMLLYYSNLSWALAVDYRRWFVWFMHLGIVAGLSLVSAGVVYLFAYTCAKAGALLLAIQGRVRRQTAGLLGFGFLATGFMLQFAGTAWQAFQVSN